MKTFLAIIRDLKLDLAIEHQEEWKAKNRTDKMFFRRALRQLY